jgi:hypothetical protein
MNKIFKVFALVTLALALLASSGCAAPKPAGLSDGQLSSTTESILKALDTNDYAAFTQDFSDKMISVFTQAQFTKLHDLLQGASGHFVSLGTPSLVNNQGYAIYRFPCKYEKETVYVTITFLIGGQKVDGLFFDSVNLRKASQ